MQVDFMLSDKAIALLNGESCKFNITTPLMPEKGDLVLLPGMNFTFVVTARIWDLRTENTGFVVKLDVFQKTHSAPDLRLV